MQSLSQKYVDLFWGHVDKEKSEIFYAGTRCWEWTAFRAILRGGYGQFSVRGKKYATHRLSYELTHGEIPNGLFVCHHCDNPPCCNPEHLFLGTNQDNVRDMWAKGRGVNYVARGEDHSNSKLTNMQVDEIRKRYAIGESNQSELAREFKVSQGLIWQIVMNNYRKGK